MRRSVRGAETSNLIASPVIPAREETGKTEFLQILLQELFQDCYSFQENNFDYLRFQSADTSRATKSLRASLLGFIQKMGFSRRGFSVNSATDNLLFVLREIGSIERVYKKLDGQRSRRLYIELLRYRILGPQHVKLSTNTKGYWEKHRSIDNKYIVGHETIRLNSGWKLNHYSVPDNSGSISLFCSPLNILNTFLLEQYAYRHEGAIVQAEEGDVVIDGGGCWGDSALYFANKVKAAGKVFCYEFDPENNEVMDKNLKMNPKLAENIEIVRNALWDKSNEVIAYSPHGPGTRLSGQIGEGQADTLAIDDLVLNRRIDKIDYLKMDIEGAELKALIGAEQTLRRFRPKLAISLYHEDEHLWSIADYLDGLRLGYRFYLDHFTIHREETVLFAKVT